MKSAVFIPVRTGSARLPEKSLLQVFGKPIIEHLIDRIKLAKLPDLIVLCTTTNPDDERLVDIAKKNNIDYFQGSVKDILKRYLDAAVFYNVDFIINIDGDDVFCDAEQIDETLEFALDKKADYIKWEGLPFGAAPIGFKFETIKRVCEMKKEDDTETGWGYYILETGLFNVKTLEPRDAELKHPEIRMTLDYQEDFEFVKEVFKRLYVPGKVFSLREILKLLESNPEIIEINRDAQQRYEDNFRKKQVTHRKNNT